MEGVYPSMQHSTTRAGGGHCHGFTEPAMVFSGLFGAFQTRLLANKEYGLLKPSLNRPTVRSALSSLRSCYTVQ
jgi:hypothetical protein